MAKFLKKKEIKQKKEHLRFEIDCKEPAEDSVIIVDDFAEFLRKRIKVNGKRGNLGESVAVNADTQKIKVSAEPPFSKRYLKYLTKKYLKKNNIRDYLHVIASTRTSYQLKYFNIQGDDAEEAE
jgi:large subunit ribosomal protein L22e